MAGAVARGKVAAGALGRGDGNVLVQIQATFDALGEASFAGKTLVVSGDGRYVGLRGLVGPRGRGDGQLARQHMTILCAGTSHSLRRR